MCVIGITEGRGREKEGRRGEGGRERQREKWIIGRKEIFEGLISYNFPNERKTLSNRFMKCHDPKVEQTQRPT